MVISTQFLLISISFSIILLFSVILITQAIKVRQLRITMNKLLEEKTELSEEIDFYAKQNKNPLGPLFSQNSSPFILSFDKTGKIINANDTLLKKFGYTKKQLIGQKAIGTILPKPKKETDSMIYRLFKNPNLFIDAETEAFTKTGQKIWISWTNRIIYDKDKPVSAEAVGFDITKRKELEAELQYLSSIDPQTGAMNRLALLQTGATELKRAQRYGRILTVVVFKFQAKNPEDSLSDTQLKNVVQLTRQNIRSVDYLGRIEDTTFALILPETKPENIPFLMQRIVQYLDGYNKTVTTKLDVFYAVTSLTKKSDTIDSLLSRAWQQVNKHPIQGV